MTQAPPHTPTAQDAQTATAAALARRRAQIKARNKVMGLFLGGLVVLLFAVSIIKTGGG